MGLQDKIQPKSNNYMILPMNLRYDRLGVALRLEQERIGFGQVKEALAKLEPWISPLV